MSSIFIGGRKFMGHYELIFDQMKPLDQQNRDWSKGNCFYVTLEFLKESELLRNEGLINKDAAVYLVHGLIGANGIRLRHAWIEIDDLVLDFSNNQEIRVTTEEYYNANNACIEKRFTRLEADALLGHLSAENGSLPICYWGEISDHTVSQAVQSYQESSAVFASDICFSDPLDPANSSNLQIEGFECNRGLQGSSGSRNPHRQLKIEFEAIISRSLKVLLEKCHISSLTWNDEVLELFIQENEDSNTARTALRLVLIKESKQVHIPTIAFPNSWRGHRLGMTIIRDLFMSCEKISYSLFITHMVESFHRYMIGIGAHRTDFETVEILPTTRLV